MSLLEQLAEFSQSAGEYGSAMEYYEQLLAIAQKARESSDLLSQIFFKMACCRSHTGEYRKALELFDAAERHLPETADLLARSRISNERAFALISLGEYDRAEACVREVTDSILDPAAAGELARAQKAYGIIAMRRGEWEAASRSFEAALAGFRLIEDRSGMAQCLNNLGLMEKNLGNFDRAIQHLSDAVAHHEASGDTVDIAGSLFNLGVAEFKSGDWEGARDRFEHALRLLEGVGNRSDVAKLCMNLGIYYRHKRDWSEAERQYERAGAVVRELGEAREIVLVQEFSGDLAFSCESFDEARVLYLAALSAGRELAPHGDLVLEVVRRLADLESIVGNLDEARTYLAEGMLLSESLEERYERGILVRIRARIEALDGDAAAAAESYREALATHEDCGTPFDLAVTRLEYVSFCIENIVDLQEASEQLEKARDTFERIGADFEAGHAYLLAAKLEMACDHPGADARHHLETAIDLLERVGAQDQEALQDVHRDIDRLLEETALSERNDLAALNDAVARLHDATDAEARVRAIESVVEERMNADRVALLLVEESGDWTLASGSNLPEESAGDVVEIIRALQGEHPLVPKPLVSTSPLRDPRLSELCGGLHDDRGSVAFMPLFSEEELIGGLYVDLRADVGYFRQPQLDFLVAFATAATMAVQEMRLESVRMENRELRRRLASRNGFEGIITQNRRMLEILDVVERVRDSNTTILLEGETGTGKELLARAVHGVSSRQDQDLVTVNCAAISGDVLESELFGHLRGSFTDAKRDKTGLFERADGGTIFLDEIDKTSTAFQERLLRVVDQGEIKPVGSSQVRKIDVRIVCATNRPLIDLVEKGQFLKDLYYRLRVIRMEIPPLRERKEDVPLLVEHFLERFNAQSGKAVAGFTHQAMNGLVAYHWPGNVRDLRHEVERAVVMSKDSDRIRLEDLSREVRGGGEGPQITLAPDQSLQDCVERIERELVRKALVKTGGNRSHAAKQLGLSRRGLLNKIARYGIDL
ncbi:sigma 54-interacting transcriptional regulator [bacterium]|nr:sigma 54-interacting transcriptional regulator [bacterium]